ncbi:MAG: hypothetical protein JW984_00120 [Deltaproteobacteria bacterium]|uniref:Globin-sensor domain-containing protein n=1 Tax=Candidatus Zymogenus saltonus TaxID=2844893 RepID=A0A9D8KAH9_9DELT|nr:hypothetical protein [Candidatus Zymogenus saltonus]
MKEQVLKDLIRLTGYSEADRETLREFSEKTAPWADEFVKSFYDTLFGYDRTAKIFGEGERQEREKTLKGWLTSAFKGDITDDFLKNLWVVGLLHIKRGVPNSFMLGIMSLVEQLFLKKCIETFEKEEATRIYGAFKRLMDVVSGVIAESYYFSYVDALYSIGGIKREVVNRMISLEIDKMIKAEREG